VANYDKTPKALALATWRDECFPGADVLERPLLGYPLGWTWADWTYLAWCQQRALSSRSYRIWARTV